MDLAARLDHLAHELADRGIDAVEPALIEIVGLAQAAGVASVALSVLADPAEPAIARARAFGMVATDLVGRTAPTGTPAPGTAVVSA